ncbi:MarR family transcriptional regulator [Streptomyces sp. NPDC095817]|uniref:MarR family winged helix-turn-helix transcriptional regulator n=1 Tax=Streptomyces sp. NPDC095817 TaxID=3155082 RepID=UPI003333FCC9
MIDHRHPASESLPAAARQVQSIVELLDVLWEQARTQGASPLVPASQLRVMCILDRADDMRMRDLIELLGARPPSVTRLIDRLQALGFVDRGACPDSRREVLLCLTRAGRAHLAGVRGLRDRLLLDALAAMPQLQRTALTGSLKGFEQMLLDQPALHLAPERDTTASDRQATA